MKPPSLCAILLSSFASPVVVSNINVAIHLFTLVSYRFEFTPEEFTNDSRGVRGSHPEKNRTKIYPFSRNLHTSGSKKMGQHYNTFLGPEPQKLGGRSLAPLPRWRRPMLPIIISLHNTPGNEQPHLSVKTLA